ncbi:carbohydrate ABC transporter permease [Lachnospiraceae bacterium OttesenSCG-928-D06]|nr:carbohydrate ABC transporter permease [Lachnospiraceae bacterium OttesenSCG-928-D06]
MHNSAASKRYQLIINIVLAIITLTIILPFLLVFISSITDENTLIRNGYSFFPEKLSLYAYQYIIRQGEKILRAYGMTIIVTFCGVILNLALSALMAYPLSVKTLPHRKALTFFVFFTMLFNGGLVPTYLMYVNFFHIKNSIWALIIPNILLSANNILMIRSYFMTSIPSALYEAAKVDGANHFRILYTIVLPLGKPILVTMGLFSGLAYWNDWTNGLYYLSGNAGQKLFTIQNLLNQMITDIQYLSSGKVMGNIGAELAKLPATSIRMAIAFIAMLPLFVIYPFLQKYFSEGITLGAVKG